MIAVLPQLRAKLPLARLLRSCARVRLSAKSAIAAPSLSLPRATSHAVAPRPRNPLLLLPHLPLIATAARPPAPRRLALPPPLCAHALRSVSRRRSAVPSRSLLLATSHAGAPNK